MARQEMLMATCDRKECNTVIEIDRATVAPEGWLQITVEIDGKWDQASKLEFCSDKCVSLWARDRNKFHNGSRNATSRQEEISLAIAELHEAKGEFMSKEVQELSGASQNTVDKYIRKLVEEGKIIVSHEGTRSLSNPNIYALSGKVQNANST